MAELTGPHRDPLIEATVAEFATAGYDGASLNRIIRAAGMSKSSFYHAVSSKAELFDAVVEALIADVRSRWSPPSPADFAGDAFWVQVDRVLGDLAALGAEERALAMLGSIFYLPATVRSDTRSALLGAVREWVAEVLRVGVASGAVRSDLPVEVLVAAAFGMLQGLDEWALGAAASSGGTAVQLASVAASAPAVLLRGMLAT
ncbi:TetR/AcrR family transcriptional regulator [Microbacterium sp. Mu-80]|uniref:TetR/AcrR family transcriptional regulator n=1 Tax=Microbacterium bandirmense TaxID=3122050 RepID=A0ABU8LFA1_9MICO